MDLLVDVVDIVLHCVDHNHIKNRPMTEVFAPVCQFPQVRVSRNFIIYIIREAVTYSSEGRAKLRE